MFQLLGSLIELYAILMLGAVILSWFPTAPDSPLASVKRFLYVVTEPVLTPLRSILPVARVGGMGLDLAPTLAIFVLFILASIVKGLGT